MGVPNNSRVLPWENRWTPRIAPPFFCVQERNAGMKAVQGFMTGKPFPTANCDMIEPGPVVRRLEVSG